MDHSPHLLNTLVNLDPGPLDASLGKVDRVGQQITTLLDAMGIGAIRKRDALVVEELAEVLVQLVLLDLVHGLQQ